MPRKDRLAEGLQLAFLPFGRRLIQVLQLVQLFAEATQGMHMQLSPLVAFRDRPIAGTIREQADGVEVAGSPPPALPPAVRDGPLNVLQ
jgi:hypothetical protein